MRQFHLFSLTLILMTTACGFHLRGMGGDVQSLPYQVWQIDKTQSLEEYLHDELKRHSVKIVHSGVKNAAEIRVLSLVQNRDVNTLSRIGTVSEYLLTLKVSVQVSYENQDIGEPISLSLHRCQSYADNDLFGKRLEENDMWQDMYKDAAMQIVRRLPYIQNNQ